MLRAILLIVRKDLTVEVRSRETGVHDAVLRGLLRAGLRVLARAGGKGRGGRRCRRPVDGDHVRREPGAWANVRAREAVRDVARLDARAGAETGGLSRQADSASSCCSQSRRPCSCRLLRCSLSRHCCRIRSGSHLWWRLERGVCRGRDAICRDARARAQPRCAAAGAAVSDHGARAHCRGARHGCLSRSPNSRWTSFVSGSCCSSPSTSCSSRWHCGPSNRL